MTEQEKQPINIKYYIDVVCSFCNKSRKIYKHSIKKNNRCKACASSHNNCRRGLKKAVVDNKIFCSTCKEYKVPDEFHNNKAFLYRMGKSLHCKQCHKIKKTIKRKRVKTQTLKQFYKSVKNDKRAKHLNFNISYEKFVEIFHKQSGKCAITAENLTFIKNKNKVYTNISIDRIDSNKDYTEDNVQFVCYIVNIMKNTLTLEELKMWCNKILCPNQN